VLVANAAACIIAVVGLVFSIYYFLQCSFRFVSRYARLLCRLICIMITAESILSVESNQNVESKTTNVESKISHFYFKNSVIFSFLVS